MKWARALLAATAVASCAQQVPDSRNLSAPLPDPLEARLRSVEHVLENAGFSGEYAVAKSGLGTATRSIGMADGAERPWPWASVTKQVVAVMVMQQVEAGRLGLDEPVARYIAEAEGNVASPTIRQLLQHRSGLRNSDDSEPDKDGVPSFYTDGPTGLSWCLQGRASPPEEGWRYNNCDYVLLGTVLERVGGQTLDDLFRNAIAEPAGLRGTRFLGADEMREIAAMSDDFTQQLPRYGAAGALVGPVSDIIRFDAALLDGTLLSERSRAVLWNGEPQLGYMALGQWVFEAPLGCDVPLQIVERRGNIGKYQVRNIILPQNGTMFALVTANGEFDFGEIWTGSGPMHDVLGVVACR